jgi:hypothetical protein
MGKEHFVPKTPPADEDAGEFRYDPELGPGYFVQLRSDFMRSAAFKPLVKTLYGVLLTYAAEGAEAWPGQARLARECAVSEPTLRTAIRALKDAELLTVRRRGQGRTNLYHLHKLPTLGTNPERKNLPFSTPERKNLPFRNPNDLRSRAQRVSVELESGQTESAEEESRTPFSGGEPPYSPYLAQVVLDHARELGAAPRGPAAVNEVLRLWVASGLNETAFAERLHAARTTARHGQGCGVDKWGLYLKALHDEPRSAQK